MVAKGVITQQNERVIRWSSNFENEKVSEQRRQAFFTEHPTTPGTSWADVGNTIGLDLMCPYDLTENLIIIIETTKNLRYTLNGDILIIKYLVYKSTGMLRFLYTLFHT
jgi:hypothetical protein